MFLTPAYAASSETGEHAEGEGHATEMHTETGVADHGGGHEAGFPPFESTYFGSQLLWLAISFGIFYLVISRMVAPRIGGILEDRQDRIARDLDEASRMKAEADEAIEAYEQELAEAKAKAGSIAGEARDEARAKADAERAEAEAELAEKITAAETRIAGIKDAALAEVGTIAEETATAIVEQLTGAKATKAEVSAAVKAAGE